MPTKLRLTKLKSTIVPVDVFLNDYLDKYTEAVAKISPKYENREVNYDFSYKDNPANIYQKFSLPHCYISMVFGDYDEIIALSMSYGYDDKTCILGSRSFVIEDPGYIPTGLLSSYCIPLQMMEQRKNYQYGITTFNLNKYSERLWRSHCRMLNVRWEYHKRTILEIFPDYIDYPRAICSKETMVINNCEQRYSIVKL